MNKKSFSFDMPNVVNVVVPGKNSVIEVRPYITVEEMYIIIGTYISNYFNDVDQEVDILGAEYTMMLQIIDMNTNIDIGNQENPINVDAIVANGIWQEITKNIVNYYDLRVKIESYITHMKNKRQLENSGANILSNLAKRLSSIVENFETMDAETMQQINQDIKKNVEDISKSPIANALKDSKRRKKE